MRPRVADRRAWAIAMALFSLSLGIRLVYLYQLWATPFADELQLMADVRYYHVRATEVASGVLFPDVPGFLSPGYCYLLGAIYAVLGPSLLGAKIVQALLGAASTVLLFLIGRRLFSENVGLIAGVVLAVYATHVYYTGILLPTIAIVFIHLLLIWILVEGWAPWRAALGGVLIGLSILAKANALLLLPALSVWIWLACPLPGRRPRWVRVALVCGFAAATVAPITINNYRVSRSFLLVTTTGGANLLKANGPTATGTHAFLPAGAQATGVAAHLQKRVDPAAAAEQARRLSTEAWGYMREHPGRTLGLFWKKLLLLFNARELGIRDQFYFVAERVPILRFGLLPFWAVVPLGLVGALYAFGSWRRLGALYAVISVQIASFVLIFVLARYRLVLVACLMPFAAWFVLRAVDWVRERRLRRLAPALALLVGFVAIGSFAFDDLPRGHGLADQYQFVADHEVEQGRLAEAAASYQSALASSWIDPRRVESQTWRVRFRLAEIRIELGRSAEARRVLDELLRDVERAYPGIEHPLLPRIRELAERIDVVR